VGPATDVLRGSSGGPVAVPPNLLIGAQRKIRIAINLGNHVSEHFHSHMPSICIHFIKKIKYTARKISAVPLLTSHINFVNLLSLID